MWQLTNQCIGLNMAEPPFLISNVLICFIFTKWLVIKLKSHKYFFFRLSDGYTKKTFRLSHACDPITEKKSINSICRSFWGYYILEKGLKKANN